VNTRSPAAAGPFQRVCGKDHAEAVGGRATRADTGHDRRTPACTMAMKMLSRMPQPPRSLGCADYRTASGDLTARYLSPPVSEITLARRESLCYS